MEGCAAFFVVILAFAALLVAFFAILRANEAKREVAYLRTLLEAQRTAGVSPAVAAPSPPPQPKPEPKPAVTAPPPPPKPAVVETPMPVFTAPPPPPPPIVRPAPAPPRRDAARPAGETPARPVSKPFDWEALIGVKLFSWIAGIALVLAAVFFLSYSVQHGWLRPPLRAAIGILSGTALIVVCEMRMARGYKLTADALDGAGIAILYATLFAAHALWHLAAASVVFGAMIIVTAVAVALSIRRDSVFIALLGLLGGFATPALLSTGENKPIALFTYLLILNVGLAWVAMTKRWPLLTALTVVLTIIYEWSWLAKFMTVSQLPLAAAIFAVFGLGAGAMLFFGRRGDGQQARFDVAAVAGATMPLLFAVFGAAVPAYGARFNILFGFLLLVTAALSVIAVFRAPRWLHLAGGAGAVLVFVVWSAVSYTPQAWPVVLAWLAAFVLVQLAASHFSEQPNYSLAPPLLAMFPILLYLEKAAASPWLLFGTLFVLLALIAAYALLHEAGPLYFIAAFTTIAAEAVWSAKYLAPERIYTAVALYAVFAIFFLGVPVAARRFQRQLGPPIAMQALLLASIALLLFLGAGPAAGVSLWGLAILLAITNAGMLMEARSTANPVLSAAGALLSWGVIGTWFYTSLGASNLIPGLTVAAGFGLLSIGGSVWASSGAPEQRDDFGKSIVLALFGHAFLLVCAASTELALPPWPIFAVLLVLDLAMGAASVYLKRQRLMAAAVTASQVVLMVWASTCDMGRWPLVALAATLFFAALGVLWLRFDRAYAIGALLGLFAGEVVAMIAGNGKPSLTALGATEVLLLIGIVAVATYREWLDVPILAVAFAALATALAPAKTPSEQFLFALPFYAIFMAWPLILGSRVRQATGPHLAAVLASGVFFVFARRAMIGAQLDGVIGILPVAEAAVLLLLVWRLLRIERHLTRLAIVAAAALAFITAAIPLQLEKQWITIGWALEGAALVWLFRRVPHRGLLAWAAALLGAVFVRLVFNPAIFDYHPVSHTAIVNWYLYTYVVAAAAFYAAAKLLPAEERERAHVAVPLLGTAGTVLLFALLNIEIADFYSTGQTITFNFFSSSLAQDLTYTIGWGLFAVGLLAGGILLHSRGTRIAAIVLLLVTIFKCFLHDLGRLGGLYRVGSLLGLALSIVVVAVLLQRFVIRPAPVEETP